MIDAPFKRKLSVLIPSLVGRRQLLTRLFSQFKEQLGDYWADDEAVGDGSLIHIFTFKDVQILVYKDDGKRNIGCKRNKLLEFSATDYTAFIDDDDRIGNNYFKLLFEGIEKGVDCCSLLGEITEDGKNPLLFEHSIKYKEYKTNTPDKSIRYERFPNHLNCIKASIAKQFKFPEKNHGEDTDWATQIFKSALIKTEHYIPEILYYYDWVRK